MPDNEPTDDEMVGGIMRCEVCGAGGCDTVHEAPVPVAHPDNRWTEHPRLPNVLMWNEGPRGVSYVEITGDIEYSPEDVAVLRARLAAALNGPTTTPAEQAVIDAAKAWAVTYGPRADPTVVTESVKDERRLKLYFAVMDLLGQTGDRP